jgi:GAF domain-containing protein
MLVSGEESSRLDALKGLDLLDTTPEDPFDALVGLVADTFDASICAISLIDRDRQWFKASLGLEVFETPRDVAFCDHTIRRDDVLVVGDACADSRFSGNPLVTAKPFIRFYAGAQIHFEGQPIGALCVADQRPRADFSSRDKRRLCAFADMASRLIDIRKSGWPLPLHYHYVD